MSTIELSSDKDYFVFKKSKGLNGLSNFVVDTDDIVIKSFLPRTNKDCLYVIKKLDNGKFIMYEGYNYNNSFGLQYDKITPISGGAYINSDNCYALKVEKDGKSYYISPIDLLQTPLETEVQSIIMSSFISDSYKIFSKAVSEVEFSDMIAKNKYFHNFYSLDTGNVYSLKKCANPPVSNAIDTSRYGSKMCEILAGRFYLLIDGYKKTILESNSISKKAKQKLFTDFFPQWEDNTLKKLFEISQAANKSSNKKSSNLKENNLLLSKVNKATINTKENMTDEEAKQIRDLLTENTIDNGGTLEYATLTRDFYVTVESDGEILGYVGLVNYGDGRLYVGVTAVKKEYQGLGIGGNMYEFIKQHSSQFSTLSADVRNFNTASKKLHFAQGFNIVDKYGTVINPNDLVYNDSYNLELKFDLTTIKDRKPFVIGKSMKLADLNKSKISNEVELER